MKSIKGLHDVESPHKNKLISNEEDMICKICGNETNNTIHIVNERILNKGDSFHYLECGACGTWQMIDDVNLSDFYPSDYNPFTKKKKRTFAILRAFRNLYIKHIIHSDYHQFDIVSKLLGINSLIKRISGTNLQASDRILDVGCAKGNWLDELYDAGYKNITGVDLFVPQEQMSDINWHFIKGEIFDLNNKTFDLITLNHSFEHMPEPKRVMQKISELLSEKGCCEISIPLAGGTAHKMFGECFCQLDAPRHLFLLTVDAMEKLCSENGLEINRIIYDSIGLIFSISEGYRDTKMGHEELMRIPASSKWKHIAKESNAKGCGDQAIFYLRKKI